MLKTRVLTATVLIPTVIAGLFFLPYWAFMFITLALLLVCGWEWSRLSGFIKARARFSYVLFVFVSLLVATRLPIRPVLMIAGVWWVMIGLWLIIVEKRQLTERLASEHSAKRTVLDSINGLFVLIPCWLTLNGIYMSPRGAHLLLWLLLMVWSVDISAYFAGKAFGKRKFAPTLSPNKTWGGFAAGMFAGTLVGVIGFHWIIAPWTCFGCGAVVGLATSLFCVVGDLYESLQKRCQGLKESGTCLPGHGGLMDRLDSLMAATPVFALSLMGFL